MSDIYKHIKKVFNKSALHNEDWLDPSDRVLANIEAEINKKDEKDRSFLFLLLTALLLVIGLSLYLFVDNPNNDLQVDYTTEQKVQPVTKRKVVVETAEVEASEELKLQTESLQTRKESKQIINDTPANLYISKSNTALSKVEMVSDVVSKNLKTNINLPQEEVVHHTSAQHSRELKNREEIKITASDLNDTEIVENALDVNTKEYPVSPQKMITGLPLLATSEVKEMNSEFTRLPTFTNETQLVKTEVEKGFVVSAGLGYAYWQFKLNDAYASAVEPAAFENSTGNGAVVFLEVGKQINNKLGLSAQVNYQVVSFSSGHNSQLNYDNTLDSQSQILTMATPLGFIDNEVVLRRNTAPSNSQETLLVDLHNKHTLQAVEFNLLADVKVVQNSGFVISLQPGIGLSQIIKTSNELSDLNTNSTSYTKEEGGIEGEFENLNRTSPVASLNINFSKLFSNDMEIGLQLTGKTNLRPIQETGVFKTNVHSVGVNAVVRKTF